MTLPAELRAERDRPSLAATFQGDRLAGQFAHSPETRALLHRAADALELADKLRETVIEMHKADRAFGCGFYGDERWSAAYELTLKLASLTPLPATPEGD